MSCGRIHFRNEINKIASRYLILKILTFRLRRRQQQQPPQQRRQKLTRRMRSRNDACGPIETDEVRSSIRTLPSLQRPTRASAVNVDIRRTSLNRVMRWQLSLGGPGGLLLQNLAGLVCRLQASERTTWTTDVVERQPYCKRATDESVDDGDKMQKMCSLNDKPDDGVSEVDDIWRRQWVNVKLEITSIHQL